MTHSTCQLHIQQFSGFQPYSEIYESMKSYTVHRDTTSADQLWLLEHLPVFTQGQAGKAEHLLAPGDIPVVQSDRGGQVTYHGPGQLMIYVLWDLKRLQLGVKSLVCALESLVITLLNQYNIQAHRQPNAPGIYVDNQKIASLGLRIKKGGSYHGVSLNVAMDLEPFSRINPCGFKALQMTQISHFCPDIMMDRVKHDLKEIVQAWYNNRLCKLNNALQL